MNENPFPLVSSREVYKNPWLKLREDKVIRPGGKEGIFGIVTMNPGSTVLAITQALTVFVTREYKYGLGNYSIELVSGALNPGESALEAAQRELEEEIGYTAGRWLDAGLLHPFTTIVDSPNYMFIALELEKSRQNLDEGEVLTFEELPFAEAHQMVMDGKITHGASCLLLLKAYHILKAENLL